jgi:nitrogen fixation-related uncharacterized protein
VSMIIIIWILLGIAVLLGLAISIVLLENIFYNCKQKQYDDLHIRMGLESSNNEHPLSRQRESK